MNSDAYRSLVEYFSTNGTLEQAANFAQLVASESWNQIAHLAKIMGL